MQRRKTILIGVAAAGVIAVAVLLWLRRGTPVTVHMLPEADGYVYFDLRPMRAAGLFDRLPEVQLAPEYRDFVQQTGIQPERDLDQAAFAIHLPSGPEEAEAQETRFSEIFSGRFDPEKLRSFLQKTATSTHDYQDTTVFEIPLPGRTVRAAILDGWGLGASNSANAEAIHHILNSQSSWSRSTAALLREYYSRVPIGSPVWAIVRASGDEGNANLTLPGGFRVRVPEGTVLVTSLRYTGEIEFRAETFTRDAAEAERLSSHLGAYLSLIRAIRAGVKIEGVGEDFQKLLDSLRVEREENRVILSASVSPKLLEQIFAAMPQQAPTPPAPKTKP